MRKAHERVIEAFIAGKPAHDPLPSGGGYYGQKLTVSRLHTDGRILYSYRMAIAKRLRHGAGAELRPERDDDKVSYVLVEHSECPSNTTRAHLQSLRVALYKDKELVTERKTVAPDFQGHGWAEPAETVAQVKQRRLKEIERDTLAAIGKCPECREPTEDGLCRNPSCSAAQPDLESAGGKRKPSDSAADAEEYLERTGRIDR